MHFEGPSEQPEDPHRKHREGDTPNPEAFASDGNTSEITPLTPASSEATGHVPQAYANDRPDGPEPTSDIHPTPGEPSPQEWEHAALSSALTWAGTDRAAQSYVLQHTPVGCGVENVIAWQAYEESPRTENGIRILAERARRPGDDGVLSWMEALPAATEHGSFYADGEFQHPLELLAPGQATIDPLRLDSVEAARLQIPNTYSQPRVLRSVAVARADAGDIDGAERTTSLIDTDTARSLEQAAEAKIAIAAAYARASRDMSRLDQASSQTLAELGNVAPSFYAWGKLAVAVAREGSNADLEKQGIMDNMRQQWGNYSQRQHMAIIHKLTEAGQHDAAASLALEGFRSDNIPSGARQVYAKMALSTAHLQEIQKPGSSLPVLEELRAATFEELHRLYASDSAASAALQSQISNEENIIARIAGQYIAVTSASTDYERQLHHIGSTLPFDRGLRDLVSNGFARAIAARGDIKNADEIIAGTTFYPNANKLDASEAEADSVHLYHRHNQTA